MKKKNAGLTISVAFLVVFALFSSELPFQHFGIATADMSVTLGNTDAGSLAYRFGTNKDASRFLLNENGVMQSISVYFSNSRFYAKAAIYSDADGQPSQLVTQSNSERINARGWHTFALPQNTLTPGYYWFTIVCSSSRASGRVITRSQTSQHYVSSASYHSEFGSTFGTPIRIDFDSVSIYGTYIPIVDSGQLLFGIYWDETCSNATSSSTGDHWRKGAQRVCLYTYATRETSPSSSRSRCQIGTPRALPPSLLLLGITQIRL